MKKKVILLSSMLMLGISIVNAQGTAYTYVKQNNTYVEDDGTAAFDVESNAAVMGFDDQGNGIMTMGDVTIAKLTSEEMSIDCANKFAHGVLAADFDNQSGSSNTTAGTIYKIADSNGYSTVYSPFQLSMPISIYYGTTSVYAPTFVNGVLKCNSGTKIDLSTYDNNITIPVCTSLLLKDNGGLIFKMSSDAPTDTHTSALSGYAVTMPVPTVATGNKVYTLGHEDVDTDRFGFFHYLGDQMNAAKAYLVASSMGSTLPDDSASASAKYIHFDFSEDTTTAISNVETGAYTRQDGKYFENGRVVIVKNGQKYNTIGQEVQ